MHQRMALVLFIFLVPGIALAKLQHAPSTAKTPSDFKFSGYADGSYNYLQNSNKFASGTYDRVFDINPNGLTLQQVGITLAYQPQQGFGGLMTPVAGSDPNIFAPYGWNIRSFAMPQAYMQYASGSLTFMGGSFIELAGAENIFSYNDSNFSRSILWGYAEPFTVTGFRVSYIPNNQLTLVGGINNGWDNIRDTSRQKTIELGASYTFNPQFSLAAYAYSGQQRVAERTSSGLTGQRSLIDLIATLTITEQLSFVINYDGALQTKAALPNGTIAEAVWQGIAGYLNYQLNQKWRTSLRGEIFSDRNGYRTGVAQTWDELTVTLSYFPIKNLEFRAETRRDFSNVSSFLNKNDITTSHNQQSFALEGIFRFT